MATVQLICEISVKWWAKPLLLGWGALFMVFGREPPYGTMSRFATKCCITTKVKTIEVSRE